MNLLFEIGTEELPPSYIGPALKQMERLAQERFGEARIAYGEIKTYGTPRRLVLIVRGLSEKQEDISEKVFGPPASVAFDTLGKPTQAAIGFAKSQGVDVGDLVIEERGKGEYVCIEKTKIGKPTRDRLPAILADLVKSISFPKAMRWESSGMRFARPIRWLVAIADSEVIEVQIAGVSGSCFTRGHRFLGKQRITVSSVDEYIELLRREFVIVNQEERKAAIAREIGEAASAVGGKIVDDEELLERVTFMVEYPLAIAGSFSKKFLEMPRDVVVTALREHQDFFSVHDGSGNLMPYFVAVANVDADRNGKIRSGNERVLKARLEDALFYWKQDLKDGLSAMVERLSKVIWQERLGTLREKTDRLVAISSWLCEKTGLGDISKVSRAAFLAKADLTSNMVREKEFSGLQGTMGKEYALALGEDEEVAQAIYEQYLPRFANDVLPATETGTILSLSDRIDTLVGYFGIGLIPSGSEDPYALRRVATGLTRILIARRLHVPLDAVVEEAANLFGEKLSVPLEELTASLKDFIRQRLATILTESGYRQDMVDAITDVGLDDVADALLRLEALKEFETDERFGVLITAFKRAYNITKGKYRGNLEPNGFESEYERKLFEIFGSVKPRFQEHIERRDFRGALGVLLELAEPIDKFFENVMVMVDDENLRNLRLNLLGNITHLFLRIANFSRLESS